MSRLFRVALVAALGAALLGMLVLGATASQRPEESQAENPPRPAYIPYHSHYVTEVPIDPGEALTLVHNLGGDPGNYIVQVWGSNDSGYHHCHYGTSMWPGVNKWVGLEWQELDSYSITVVRAANDDEPAAEKQWNKVRVLIIRVI